MEPPVNIKSAGDTAFKDCNGLRAKIAADMDALKAKVTQRKHDRGVKHAEIHSEMLDNEASIASNMPSHRGVPGT
jgi:hypothetical protein